MKYGQPHTPKIPEVVFRLVISTQKGTFSDVKYETSTINLATVGLIITMIKNNKIM